MAVSISGNSVLAGKTQVGQAFLLDDYRDAAAAYSLRKLRSGYTGSAVRVRRSSDNAEQDIGFDSFGNLDETSLLNFNGNQNLLKYSEQLNNAYWNQQNRVLATADTTETADPNNGNTAEKFTTSTQSINGGFFGRTLGGISYYSGVFTLSIYAKKGNSDIIILQILDGTNYLSRWFNIGNGTVLSQSIIGSAWTNTSAQIQNIGNGWYRCCITGKKSTTGQMDACIYTDCAQDLSYTNTLNNYNYFWGAQINMGDIQTYTQTTSTQAGMCYISKLYDQSGNSRDASMSTAASQPIIITAKQAGILNGSKIIFNGTSSYLITSFTGINLSSNDNLSAFNVITPSNIVNENVIVSKFDKATEETGWAYRLISNKFNIFFCDRAQYTQYNSTNNASTGTNYLFSLFANGGSLTTNVNSYYNGNSITSMPTAKTTTLQITTYPIYVAAYKYQGTIYGYFNGAMQEIILYNTDNRTSRTGIESNINTYYNIY